MVAAFGGLSGNYPISVVVRDPANETPKVRAALEKAKSGGLIQDYAYKETTNYKKEPLYLFNLAWPNQGKLAKPLTGERDQQSRVAGMARERLLRYIEAEGVNTEQFAHGWTYSDPELDDQLNKEGYQRASQQPGMPSGGASAVGTVVLKEGGRPK